MYLLFTFYYLHKKGVLRLFYINYVALCNKIGKSPSAVAEELGFMRSVVTRWSKGTIPRQATSCWPQAKPDLADMPFTNGAKPKQKQNRLSWRSVRAGGLLL